MQKDRTYYSERIEGARGNYGWGATYDLTNGYLGITQIDGDTVKDRVLLSPKQVEKLIKFTEQKRR